MRRSARFWRQVSVRKRAYLPYNCYISFILSQRRQHSYMIRDSFIISDIIYYRARQSANPTGTRLSSRVSRQRQPRRLATAVRLLGKVRSAGLEGAANEVATRSVARRRCSLLRSRRPPSSYLRLRSMSWTSPLEWIPIRRLRRVISITTIIIITITIIIRWHLRIRV